LYKLCSDSIIHIEIQTNKEKLAAAAFAKEDNNGKESKEPDFTEDQAVVSSKSKKPQFR
jgi:hypothetical protein